MEIVIHTDSFRYLWEVLENEEYAFLFKNLVVMDLGCNVGAFSLWVYPRASFIHAVDKDRKSLDLFRQTIKDNKLDNIRLYEERTLNLGDFMSGHGIPVVDLLKIDIEGDEFEVFENNFPYDKVRTIVGEYHDKPVKGLLEGLGYRYYEYPNQHFVARI